MRADDIGDPIRPAPTFPIHGLDRVVTWTHIAYWGWLDVQDGTFVHMWSWRNPRTLRTYRRDS